MDYINYVLCFVLCYIEIQASKGYSKERINSSVAQKGDITYLDTKLSNAPNSNGQNLSNAISNLEAENDISKNISRWIGFGKKGAKFIGIGTGTVIIKDSVSYERANYTDSIIAIAYNDYPEVANIENLIFAVNSKQQYHLTSYAVREKHLVELWSEPWPYEINNIIAWQKYLVLTSGRRLELIVKDTGFIIPASVYLPDKPTKITASIEANYCIISALLPKRDQVIVYSIDNEKDSKQFTHLLTIKSKNVKSLVSFRMGLSNYIAVGGESSAVWRLNPKEPQPIRISTGPVDHWLAIPLATYRHDVLLLSQSGDTVSVVEPDGYNKFDIVGTIDMFCIKTNENCREEVRKLDLSQACSSMDSALIPTLDGTTLVLNLNHALENIPDQFENMSDELEELRARLLKHLEIQDQLAETLMKEEVIIDLNHNNELSAKWTIDNFYGDDVDFLPVSEEDHFFSNSELFAGRSDWSEADQSTDLKELKRLAEKLRHQFNSAKNELHQFVFKDVEINEVGNEITIEGSIDANEVYLLNLNGRSVNDWLTNSVRWDYLQPILGSKTVDNIEVNNLKFDELSGVPADNLLYTDDEIVINGELVIKGNSYISNDIVVTYPGKVNEMVLTRDLFLVDQLFDGNVTFDKVEILKESFVSEILRSNHPSAILPENLLLRADDIAKISSARVDYVDVTKQLNISYINDISIEELFIKYNNHQSPEVMNVSTAKINVQYLNNRKFPDDFVRTSDTTPIVLHGGKTFASLKVKDLHTGLDVVNELFGNQSSLFFSLFSRSIDDEIESLRSERNNVSLVFNRDLQVDGSIVTEKVNNVSWQHLGNHVTSKNVENKSKRRCMGRYTSDFENNIDTDDYELVDLNANTIEVEGNLTITNKVGNIDMKDLYNYLSKTKEQVIPGNMIKSPINVTGSVTIKNTILSQNLPLTKMSVLNVTGGLNIENLTVFNHVTIDNLTVNELVSGIKLEELIEDTAMLTDEKIELRGNKLFTNQLKANNLNAHTVNGKKLSDAVTKASNVIFAGPITIKGNLEIKGDLNVLGLINNVSLSDLQSELSTSLASFYVTGDFTLAPGAVIKNLNVDGKIQGINFNEFLEDSISVNKDFEISAQNLTFLNRVTFEEDLIITKNLNNVDLKLFLADVVFLNRPSTLKNLILKNNSLITYLNATSLSARLVEGCDVGHWREEAIFLNEVSFVRGIVKFAELSVKDNVNCDTINGRPVASLITLNQAQVIPADFHFESINITKKIIVNQCINDIYMHTLWVDSLRNNGNQTITGTKQFLNDVEVHGSVAVASIGDRSLTDIITLHSEQNITSYLNFSGGATIDYNLWTNGLINEVNITEWNSRLLIDPKPQVINGSWIVNGDILVKGNILGSGIVMDKSLINTTESLKLKLNDSEKIQQGINEEFENQCKVVSDSAVLTQHQIRTLEMFEDVQGFEYKREILSVINYQSDNNNYLLVSFGNRCAGNLYKWNSTTAVYQRDSLKKIGSVSLWTTVLAHHGLYLIVSGPNSCDTKKPFGAIWHVKGSEFRRITNIEPFTDVIPNSESPPNFYTILTNSTVFSWVFSQHAFHETKVAHLALDTYKFVPFSLGLGLAVWDGDSVTTIKKDGSLSTHSRILAGDVAVSMDGLTAVTDGIGRIELFRDNKLLDLIYTPKPSHLLWLDLKSPGELYLCFTSENHKILVYQYKGVSGLVFQASLNNPASGLRLLQLPTSSGIVNYLLRYHAKTMHLIQVVINGQPPIFTKLNCTV